MQIIAVDIGNSATKFSAGRGLFSLEYGPFDDPSSSHYHTVVGRVPNVDFSKNVAWSVSSVNDIKFKQLFDWVKVSRPKDQFLSIARDNVPLKVIESYRETVGIDRLVASYAAVADAEERFCHKSLIVIDAGTAVTVDRVSAGRMKERLFEGGLIFPGIDPSLRALHHSANKLSELSWLSTNKTLICKIPQDGIEGLLGTNTQEAVSYGVSLAQAHAVGGIVAELEKGAPEAEVYITGGGASTIIRLLSVSVTSDWHVSSKLVLDGAKLVGQQLLSDKQTD